MQNAAALCRACTHAMISVATLIVSIRCAHSTVHSQIVSDLEALLAEAIERRDASAVSGAAALWRRALILYANPFDFGRSCERAAGTLVS